MKAARGLGVALAACSLIALAAAGGSAAERLPGRAQPNQGRFIVLGGEFGELRFACVSCHGFAGQADASGAFPRLADQSAWYLYSTLRAFAAGVRPSAVMGPIAAELSDDQMLDVAAYYGGVQGVPYPLELRHDQQLVEQGRKIATAGLDEQSVPACETCHGMQGAGHAPIYPYLAGQYQPYLEHQLEQFRAGRRGGDPMNVMHEIAAPLTRDQIHAVAVYFASLRPQETTPEGASRPGRVRPPAPLPMQTGAVIDPEPGHDAVVLPDR